ncbi:hypothetical protein BV20DRAFT_948649, partial [Pilatotrama ljubarskyi]
YGEAGEAVIISTLELMFPSWALEPADFSPFTSKTFMHLILGPETALHLIAQDRDLDLPEARQVMIDSAPYGYDRFPFAAEAEGTGISPAEMVVRENFRKLRALKVLAFL